MSVQLRSCYYCDVKPENRILGELFLTEAVICDMTLLVGVVINYFVFLFE